MLDSAPIRTPAGHAPAVPPLRSARPARRSRRIVDEAARSRDADRSPPRRPRRPIPRRRRWCPTRRPGPRGRARSCPGPGAGRAGAAGRARRLQPARGALPGLPVRRDRALSWVTARRPRTRSRRRSLSAYRNLARFRGDSFRSWLTRIALNAATDVLRVRKRRPADPYPEWEDDSWQPPTDEVGESRADGHRRAVAAGPSRRRSRQITDDQRDGHRAVRRRGLRLPRDRGHDRASRWAPSSRASTVAASRCATCSRRPDGAAP